jgi:V8-like Glu-specific endopeptidase
MTMNRSLSQGALVAMLVTATVSSQTQPMPFERRACDLDSGYRDNPAAVARIVFAGTIRFEQATWLRLYFADTNLPTGSRLSLTALVDQDVQTLDARSLLDYDHASAWLNGNEVLVELIAGPGTKGNRVRVDHADVGQVIAAPESICGPTDDRVPSADHRAARLGGGCTGWMMGADLAMTAGHCTSSNTLLEFRVPPSTSSGQTVRSAIQDQYNYQFLANLDGGVGADWGLGRVLPNSQTSLLPPQAYGVAPYVLGTIPTSTAGQNIRITGYGTSSIGSRNQVQQTHVGPMVATSPGLGYATDTTGGNSGSPVIHENTGNAIGVHTHGGCTSSGGNNWGTRIDRSDIQAAIRNATRVPGSLSTFGTACPGAIALAKLSLGGEPSINKVIAVGTLPLPPNQPAVLFFGVSKTFWPAAGQALPFNLAVAGMTGCQLYVSTEIDVTVDSGPLGFASVNVTIPNNQSLVGRSVFTQYLYSSPGTNPANTAATDAGEIKIGN